MVIDTMLIYNFVDPDLGFRYSWERKQQNKGVSKGIEVTAAFLYFGWYKIHAEPAYFFIASLVTRKEQLIEALLNYAFIP